MTLTRDKRQHVVKALIALSKFLGLYPQFKQRVQSFGLKWEQRTALETFNSIMSKNHEDVDAWVKEVIAKNPAFKDFMQFAELSGLRKEEAIQSFNLIIDLSKANRLSEYYNEETSCLEHFRFPELFIRRTKNAYITFMPKEVVQAITQNEKITYEAIRKRLERQGFSIKLKLLRSTWATFMEKRLTQSETDLLQGRISQTVFMQFYFSPSIQELKQRVFAAIHELEQQYHKADQVLA